MPDLADPTRPLSPQEAADLLLMRRRARVSYAAYLKYWIHCTRLDFKWNWHWDFLADVMQAVHLREEQVRFLNVNIPPRFAKSTILSQQWQAWMIGVDDSPRSSLFSISSSATLALRDSRRTLDTVRSPWYQQLFPHVRIGAKETEAEWETKGGAYRIACGRDGTVTGRGAHHLLVDDIVSAQEADSEVVREKANEFLGGTLRSRLDDQRTGTITNVQQRLHERDATGFLLEQAKTPGADQYHLISITNEAEAHETVSFKGRVYAVRKPGDLLFPEYLGRRETEALKVSQKRNYDGQYQQRPSKMQGGMLDPTRLVRMEGSANELRSRFGLVPNFYIDFATKEKQTQKDDPDYSVIAVVARDQMRRIFILDIFRKQCDYSTLANTLIAMHKAWSPRFVKGERGGLLNTFQPMLTERQRALGTFFPLFPVEARVNDKVATSAAFQGMLAAGMIHVPKNAPWLDALEREMRSFPVGAHDDQCFPGETPIVTHRGVVRIDEVTTRDFVATRMGWRRVVRAWCRGWKPVIRRFGIQATEDHKVWTARGWITLAELMPSDTVMAWTRSSSTEKCSPDTHPAPADISGSTTGITAHGSNPPWPCTSTCGSEPTDQSRRGTRSTTSTESPRTIPSPISNAYPERSIGSFTQTHLGPRGSLHTLLASENGRRNGMRARKGAIGIANTRTGHLIDRIRSSAGCAERRSSQERLSPESESAPKNAPKRMLPVSPANAVPVYDLTVEGAHEFFAWGVLVHNCDPISDACNDIDDIKLGTAPTVDPEDPQLLADKEMKERIAERVQAAMDERYGDGTKDPEEDW